jgi:hypothetical protein
MVCNAVMMIIDYTMLQPQPYVACFLHQFLHAPESLRTSPLSTSIGANLRSGKAAAAPGAS